MNGSVKLISKLLLVFFVWIIFLSTDISAQNYNLLDLGTIGGDMSTGADVNELGLAVGSATTYGGALHAFVWVLGFSVDMGAPFPYTVSEATGINYQGTVIAYAEGQNQSQYAYLNDDDNWTYLGTLPELDYSVPTGINNYDQICGYSFMLGPDGGSMAWLWQSDVMTPLGTLGGSRSKANAINQAGEIVGYSEIDLPDSSINHACEWFGDSVIDLGVLEGESQSSANDISDNGQIAGSSYHQQTTYPFLTVAKPCLWRDDQIIELELVDGYITGTASGVNNNGQVVGNMSMTLAGGDSHAFLWQNDMMYDLNDRIPNSPDWEIISASNILNTGIIVGTGINPNGQWRGILLAPSQTDAPEYSELKPSSYLIAENYPNPFNNRTVINYSIPDDARVSIDIYDILGRKVESLVEGYMAAGEHEVSWNAGNYNSGVYFYNITAGTSSSMGMMTLMK